MNTTARWGIGLGAVVMIAAIAAAVTFGSWVVLAPILVATAVILGLGMAGWRGPREWAHGISGVFTLQLLYVALLGALAGLYFTKSLGLPDSLGALPIGVPWFGAAGAITLSMTALSEHRHDWDPEWWYWHASRPLVGAIAGTITAMLFVAGIVAVQQNPQPSGHVTASGSFLYSVIAFVIGYREESFRELLKQALDVFLKPGGLAVAAQVSGIHPDAGLAGVDVHIFGVGLSQVNSVTFDGVGAAIKTQDETKLVVVAPASAAGVTGKAISVVVRTPTATFGGNSFTYT